MEIINQYSLVWFLLFSLVILGIFLFRDGVQKRDIAILAGLAAVIAVIWWQVRPQPTADASSLDVQAQIGSGLPVLLEFQSPY